MRLQSKAGNMFCIEKAFKQILCPKSSVKIFDRFAIPVLGLSSVCIYNIVAKVFTSFIFVGFIVV